METLLSIIGILSSSVLLKRFIFSVTRVDGNSMLPTLIDGQYVLVLRFLKPRLEDVIVFKLPNEKNHFVKRVNRVEKDSYYVLGDNINNSKDSRHFGNVDKKYVIGTVWPRQ